MDGRRLSRPQGTGRTLLTSLLFGVLVLVTALAGAVPASAAGPDALRVTRSVAPTVTPAIAPRGTVARPTPGRSATSSTTASTTTQHQARAHDTVATGSTPTASSASAATSPHPDTAVLALLPERRGPPSLVALDVVPPTSSSAPHGRTPAVSRSRAPPASA